MSRKPEQIAAFFRNAAKRDLFASVFVFLVAQLESFMVSICRLVLRHDSRRLKTRVPGIDHINKIETAEIIESASRDDLIERLIEREMQAVSYSRPAAFFVYLERVIGITLREDLRDSWTEMKATRDVIVHNSGIVNATYLEKSGAKGRGALGTLIPFDEAYFEQCVATIKSIVGCSEASVRKSLKPKSQPDGAISPAECD